MLLLLDRADGLLDDHLQAHVAEGRRHLSQQIRNSKQAERQSASVRAANGYTFTFPKIGLIPGILNSGGGNDFRNLHPHFNSGNYSARRN